VVSYRIVALPRHCTILPSLASVLVIITEDLHVTAMAVGRLALYL